MVLCYFHTDGRVIVVVVVVVVVGVSEAVC